MAFVRGRSVHFSRQLLVHIRKIASHLHTHLNPCHLPTNRTTRLLVFICTYLSEEGVYTSLFSCQLLPRIEQKVRLRHRDFASRGVIDRELRAEDFYKQGVIDKDTRQCLSNFSSVSLSVHLLVCPRGSRPACMTCLRAGQSVIMFVCVAYLSNLFVCLPVRVPPCHALDPWHDS